MDGITVAQNLTQLANSGQPFLLHGTTPCYTRPTSSHMDHSPTKSIYSSGWTTPYSEETSPVENYFPNHHGSYTQNSGPVLGSNAYAMHDEWTYPTKQSNNLAAIPYYDQVVPYIHNGLPMSSSSTSSSHDSEPYSSMNMTSLQMSLPERPPPQQHSTDRSYQRHLLPIPQPSSHQSSRNVVDQLQHQRLRSAHGVGTSSMSANPIYSKPLIPWVGDNNSHVNPSCKEPAESALSSCTTSDDASTFPASTCSTDGLNNAATTMPLNLNFSSSALLDTITAPSPHITYSNFRQKRTPCQPAQESTYENNSGFSMYTFETNKASRRKAKGDASPTSTLVSGHRYSPPALDISPTPYANSKSKQEFYTDHKVPVQRSSLSKLTSKF